MILSTAVVTVALALMFVGLLVMTLGTKTPVVVPFTVLYMSSSVFIVVRMVIEEVMATILVAVAAAVALGVTMLLVVRSAEIASIVALLKEGEEVVVRASMAVLCVLAALEVVVLV